MNATLAGLEWPRRSDRLALRPPRLSDVEAIHAYRSDPEVARWLTGRATSVEAVGAHVLGSGQVVVVERDGVVVGDLMVRITDAWAQAEVRERARGAQAELGWCIAPAHQRQGYAVEAVRELVTLTFELGVHRIEAGCFAANLASRRVMDRVGFRQEGYHVRESLHRDGTWMDGISFAILEEEWDPTTGRVRDGARSADRTPSV